MKKLFLACAIALGVASTAAAENYMQVYAGYAGTSFPKMYYYNESEKQDVSLGNGFEIGYTYGLGLGEESPMAVEFGIGLGYLKSCTELGDVDINISQFNIKVPVNFTYKFSLGETFAIAPYAGINFRFNPMFEEKMEAYGESETSKDGFKKFQMGWQAGAKVYYKKFFLYGQYGTDFMPAWKSGNMKCDTRNFAVGVGYKF